MLFFIICSIKKGLTTFLLTKNHFLKPNLRINESHFWIRKSLRLIEDIRGELLKISVIDLEPILQHVKYSADKLYNKLMKHDRDKIAYLKEGFKKK